MRLTALASALYEDLLHREGVTKLVLSRRAAAVYSGGSPAKNVYFLDSGLVKLEKITESGKELLLGIVAPGEIFGEQAILGDGTYTLSARVLESGIAYAIPSDLFHKFCERRPEIWKMLVQHFLTKKDELERKIEHLCLSDVKQRIVFYLNELARLNPGTDGAGSVIHISQNELASLVGATRETTSTTLNALARQGLIVLGHRLVMIPSLEMIREAMNAPKAMKQSASPSPSMPQVL